MSTYPERRPYATTVPHSGYRAKPLIPQPPADALAVLRSHIGYDDLRRSAREESDEVPRSTSQKASPSAPAAVRTAAGRTYPSPTVDPTQRLLPLTARTPTEAMAAAELQPPIEHDTLTYHGCQQAALNAELRNRVEAQSANWAARVAAIREILASLPAESSLNGNRDVEGLEKYLNVYRCTESMPVTEDGLVSACHLRTPMSEVASLMQLPPVPSDAMRRALDDLLRSPYLLAPLENYVAKLSTLDKLSRLAWSGEGTDPTAPGSVVPEVKNSEAGAATVGQEGALVPVHGTAHEPDAATVVCPSRAAVALHERLHFNPGDYAERELKKSEDALLSLQQRVQAAKQDKEAAIDASDPITALRSLHAQVDLSNDLLLLYRARMSQVGLHADDTQDFRQEVVKLVDDARRAAQAVRDYARKAVPSVHRDVGATADAIEATEKTLAAARATEKEAEAKMRDDLTTMDGETRVLWQEVLTLLDTIAQKTQARSHYVQQCMSRREQRAKAAAQAEAMLKAQSAHRERLRQCEEVLARWEEMADVYTKYVEACVPKLLKHLSTVEDTDEDLTQREAEGYVAVFEQFVYAAEEARAKRRTQADRMRLLQRSVQLNQERADATMDPDTTSHAQRLADATRELEEVQLYLKYINEIEEDRRAEVDPVLKRMLVRHAQSQIADANAPEHTAATGEEEIAAASSSQPPSGMLEDAQEGGSASASKKGSPGSSATTPAEAAAPAAAPPTSATNGTVATRDAAVAVTEPAASAAAATMAHPFVAARQVGLTHEENYLLKQEQLTERELRELEAKQTGVRHSKEELKAMETKYQNAEAIRALLGLT